MPTGSFEFETFGINRARVAPYGTYPASWSTIPITKEGTLTLTTSKAEVADGEGDLDNTWFHSQRAMVKLTAAKQSMKILEIVSGNTVSSSGGIESIYFGTEGELTSPLVMLELDCVATDPAAAVPSRVYQTVILFKCRVKFPDLEYKAAAPGEIVLEFDSYKSIVDEKGNTIPIAFGQLKSGSSTLPA